jgi:hypothetical protein
VKMKREIFSRGVRMTHPFEELITRGDPLGTDTFSMDWPKRVDDLSKLAAGRPCSSQQYGQHNDRPDSSPVSKPGGGVAHMDGPAPDYAMIIGRPIPVGTKRRLGPPKADK